MFTDTSKVNTIPQNLALIPNKLLGRQQKRPVFFGGGGLQVEKGASKQARDGWKRLGFQPSPLPEHSVFGTAETGWVLMLWPRSGSHKGNNTHGCHINIQNSHLTWNKGSAFVPWDFRITDWRQSTALNFMRLIERRGITTWPNITQYCSRISQNVVS